MSAAPIYVVVCQNDKAHPQWGRDEKGPIVHESYTSMTLEQAHARCAAMEQHGACRIGRVIFEDEPGFDPDDDGSGNPDAQMGRDWPMPGDGDAGADAKAGRRGRKAAAALN